MTFDPGLVLPPASAVTGIQQQEQHQTRPVLRVPRLQMHSEQQQQQNYGSAGYAIEFVVQDFGVEEEAGESATSLNRPHVGMAYTTHQQQQQHSRPVQLMEVGGRDTDSGCSVTTCSDHTDELGHKLQRQQQQQQQRHQQQHEEHYNKQSNKTLLASPSLSSDEMDLALPFPPAVQVGIIY